MIDLQSFRKLRKEVEIPMNKKISVIIPNYNEEKYIEECLQSLLAQTFDEFEIIIVDDGSTDNSVSIIKKYMEIDSRISLIEQKNQYAGAARNHGMRIATGDYLCFLDADDFFEPNMLEALWKKAIETDADIVICDCYTYDNETGEIAEKKGSLDLMFLEGVSKVFNYRDLSTRIFQISSPEVWTKLYKRQFVIENKLEFQNIKKFNDVFFSLLSMVSAKRIVCIQDRLIKYRINNPESLQGIKDRKENILDFFSAVILVKEKLTNKNVYEEVEQSLINLVLSVCVDNLYKQENLTGFLQLYEFIKNKIFVELDIAVRPREFFYFLYEERQNIMRYDAVEYLFHSYRKLRTSREIFVFPYKELFAARNIIIYAAGEKGKAYYRQIMGSGYYKLVAWVDKNYKRYENSNLQILPPEVITEKEFDKVIIAIEDLRIKKEAADYLISLGIAKEKII